MDILINLEEAYVRKVSIGKFGICEIPNIELFEFVKNFENNVFVETKYNEFLFIKNKKLFKIESEGVLRDMWLAKIVTFEQMIEISDIGNKVVKKEGKSDIQIVSVIYGRCVCSMTFLDKVYRDYLYRHKFIKNEVVAVKSVAGSGKTTTLLELSKIHSNKKILYIAFNKSLITEIKEKIKDKKITNLFPVTFDALAREVFIYRTDVENPDITDLKPQNIGEYVDWFSNKPYRIKNYYIKNFNKFCNQTKYSDMKTFCEKVLGGNKPLLNNMWEKALKYEFITFDTIRKIVELNHWCQNYIDNKYNLIFIDESQDFDNTMLKILLEDTTISKLFVGDTRQAIYEWKGCINAFDKLPENSLILEFYSSFRVGNPACDEIRDKFKNCWMISKSVNETHLKYDIEPDGKYVYLFRNWRNLLQTAQYLPNIWIHNFQSQIDYIKRLHSRLKIGGIDEDELNEFSDDLPKFLLKLSVEELEKMIHNIESNIVDKKICNIEMYTIHSYKGLEEDTVRIYNDIDLNKEHNLHYVALTRGKKNIIIDKKVPIFENDNIISLTSTKKRIKQKNMTSYL